RPARNNADAGLDVNLLERQRVFVEERPAFLVSREIRLDGGAELETEENAALDPRVHAPPGWRRRIGLRGADFASRQRVSERREQLANLLAIRGGAGGGQTFDVGFELGRPHAVTPPVTPTAWSTASIRCFDAGRGGTIGRR